MNQHDPAPLDAQALDEQNNLVSLHQFLGKWIVVYFYPKDDTPGCTTQACAFRDASTELSRLGAIVVGVSADDQTSHRKFKEKHQLPFPLWTDASGEFRKAFEVGSLFNTPSRTSFLIDPSGTIVKIWSPAKPESNAVEVIATIEQAQFATPSSSS